MYIYKCFSGGSDSQVSACNAGDLGSIPGVGRSCGGEHGDPLQCSCLKNTHGEMSFVGYSPWDHKELDIYILYIFIIYTYIIYINNICYMPILKYFEIYIILYFFCVFLPPLNIICFCQVHITSVLYCTHLCMKCSLGVSNFLEEISSFSHYIVFLYFFAFITEKVFLIFPCYSLELCIQMGISFVFFSFLLCLSLLFFSQLFIRPP